MVRNNPIPIVKDLPAKERNLWTGVILVIAIWLTPALFNIIAEDLSGSLQDLFEIAYLIIVAMLMLSFLLYTTPTNPTMYKRRRKQFLMLFFALLGYLAVGIVLIIFFAEWITTPIGTTIVMDARVFNLWFYGLVVIFSVTFIWYLVTMWHRNPAAVFFPNPIFLIKKHPKRSSQSARSHKNMKQKLGRK